MKKKTWISDAADDLKSKNPPERLCIKMCPFLRLDKDDDRTRVVYAARKFLAAFRTDTSLKKLKLFRTALYGTEVSELAEILKTNTSLTRLNLGRDSFYSTS